MENLTDGQVQPAWDLRAIYARVFDGPIKRNVEANKTTVSVKWLEDHANDFETIFSSIPPQAICLSPQHTFAYQTIYVDTSSIGFVEPNTIVYNGEPHPSWSRASNINGHCGTEWSSHTQKPPLPNLVEIRKPLWNNCDCWPDVIRVGRYGEWRKGVLVDDAFKKVMSVFDQKWGRE
jgi:hypothetical protein